MGREFDLHVSVRFKGGEYYSSFQANSHDEFLEALKDHWYDTGLHQETGEIFVLTEVDTVEGPYRFEAGSYRFDETADEVIGVLGFPSPGSMDYVVCIMLGLDPETFDGNEEEFFNAVSKALVIYDKAWADHTPEELADFDQRLEVMIQRQEANNSSALSAFKKLLDDILASDLTDQQKKKKILLRVEMYGEYCSPEGALHAQGVHLRDIPEHYLDEEMIFQACSTNVNNIADIPEQFQNIGLYRRIWEVYAPFPRAEQARQQIPEQFSKDL